MCALLTFTNARWLYRLCRVKLFFYCKEKKVFVYIYKCCVAKKRLLCAMGFLDSRREFLFVAVVRQKILGSGSAEDNLWKVERRVRILIVVKCARSTLVFHILLHHFVLRCSLLHGIVFGFTVHFFFQLLQNHRQYWHRHRKWNWNILLLTLQS